MKRRRDDNDDQDDTTQLPLKRQRVSLFMQAFDWVMKKLISPARDVNTHGERPPMTPVAPSVAANIAPPRARAVPIASAFTPPQPVAPTPAPPPVPTTAPIAPPIAPPPRLPPVPTTSPDGRSTLAAGMLAVPTLCAASAVLSSHRRDEGNMTLNQLAGCPVFGSPPSAGAVPPAASVEQQASARRLPQALPLSQPRPPRPLLQPTTQAQAALPPLFQPAQWHRLPSVDSGAANAQRRVDAVIAQNAIEAVRIQEYTDLVAEYDVKGAWKIVPSPKPVAKPADDPAVAPPSPSPSPPPPPPAIAVDEFVPLPAGAEEAIKAVWDNGAASEVITVVFSLDVTRDHFRTLRNRGWLNDMIINFYMEMIMARSVSTPTLPKTWIATTFFYSKIKEKGHAGVARWTKRIKETIFAMDYVIFPLHIHGNHWACGVVNFKLRRLEMYDSLGPSEYEFFRLIRTWLIAEAAAKNRQGFSLDGWTEYAPTNCPRQDNGVDCGVFLCKFADFVSREVPLNFGQQHIPYFRMRIAHEILQTKLL